MPRLHQINQPDGTPPVLHGFGDAAARHEKDDAAARHEKDTENQLDVRFGNNAEAAVVRVDQDKACLASTMCNVSFAGE